MKTSVCVVGLLALAAPVRAQEGGWEYSATMYGWLTGITNTVETPVGNVTTEADFSDVWDALDIAVMGSFEARRDRWSLIGDLVYSDLSSASGLPGPLFALGEVDTKLTLLSGYASYRVVKTNGAMIDIAGGLRWYDLDIDVGLSGGAAAPRAFSFGDSWIDPVVAARVTVPLSDRWSAAGFVDVGGFGLGDASDLSWQILASVGYRFNDTWSARFGYRYMSIEQKIDGADVDLEISGPMIGLTARF